MKPTIRQLDADEMSAAAKVIRAAFATVAGDLNLTRDNCPTNPAFIEPEHLLYDRQRGAAQYGAFLEDELIGFFELFEADGSVNLKRLAVEPAHRHHGVGRDMLDFAADAARGLGAGRLTLDYIEENATLKAWYLQAGFVFTGTKKFDHLPFTVGFMEMAL